MTNLNVKMRRITLVITAAFFLFLYPIYTAESFDFSGKLMCELSASFIVFDFENKIAIRNNYNSSQYRLSNYETKKNKFKKTIHTFSWYDLKSNFIGYWVISDDSKKIEEIKFDKNGEIFFVSRNCSVFNTNNIGELVW